MRGSRSAVILLCLLGCNVWKAVTKTLQEENPAREVTLKVHLSDGSTHQPIPGATVEIFANHSSFAAETTGLDGSTLLRFPYRVGTALIITASKPGYVPNSAPWQPARLPVFSSLSLDLLPERRATLMVYDDVVQIISSIHGLRAQPWVQFQRRALSVPHDSSYTNLTTLLTLASSHREVEHFPFLQGIGGNGTGSNQLQLTPVTALSVHLLDGDGTPLQVSEPISISVPLPPDCGLKENDHIPAWRFDPKLGAWLKSSLGYVQKDRDQLILTYIAPQLGYWAAAMSPLNTGAVEAKDISTYHTVFLLAILGGMALILLFLLCLLLYYCRRKCLRPRLHHRKLHLSSALDQATKRDQSTSMSNVNLISEVHLELVSPEPGGETELHTPMLRPTSSSSSAPASTSRTSLVKEHHRASAEVLAQPLSPLSSTSSSQQAEMGCEEVPAERRPTDYLLSRSVDHLERPASLPHPGQLLCCSSVDQMTDGTYRKSRPTLVIPAHYMKLPGEHPYAGQPLLLQTEQQSDLETIQAELSASHRPTGDHETEPLRISSHELQSTSMPESLSIPSSLSETGLVQINGEDQLLAEKTLMELRGGKPLPHPRAWFVSLDGRSNAHIRHSYIDLQRAGGSNDASLDSGVDMNEPRLLARRIREGGAERERVPPPPPVSYTQLTYVDDVEAYGSDGATPSASPEDGALGALLQEAQDLVPEEEEQVPDVVMFKPEPSMPELRLSPASPPSDEPADVPEHDDSGEEENKKSPWQKREERPLLAFNLN